ncbi:hypothetical protein [Micromonospora psammae]|uniref:hypothetical protein n=1 Tax=Micromonospora sp. CPCC 205556 TaxID=3122398 RepID=UPI002FEEA9CF
MINDSSLFAGLDDVDWAALHHAYGPAVEVPELLRGLVDDDPAARETALDGMYGAVHHQGDVYDSTLATIPFLLDAAARPQLPGRGPIVELLGSYAGAEYDDVDEDEDDEYADEEEVAHQMAARAAIADARPVFLALLDDPDPQVRAAAAGALMVRPDAGISAALSDRLAVEADEDVRKALLDLLGRLGRLARTGRLTGVDPAGLLAPLVETLTADGPPQPRLAALAQLVEAAEPPGVDVVATALALFDALYAREAPPPSPAGFTTDTLRGAVRQLGERELAGRPSPPAAPLVQQLSAALGDRVGERTRLLTALLDAPEWYRRHDAIAPVQRLVDGWRGPYRELVARLGEQLLDPEPRLAGAAASSLRHLDVLAEPAADAMVRALDAAPREARHDRGAPPWVIRWGGGEAALGPVPVALAALADRRVLPVLRWALEQDQPPEDVGQAVAALGPAAAELVPLIRDRLRDLPDAPERFRSSLVYALGRIGPAAAPCLPELLARLPDDGAARALAALGPAAVDAVPALRRATGSDEWRQRLPAASALWQVTGDAELVLPVLARSLEGTTFEARDAARGLAELGPAAAGTAPRLRELCAAADSTGWLPLAAAVALWRVTGDAAATLPTLLSAWRANSYTAREVVRHLAEFGPLAADAVPLLRAELARVRRHNVREATWTTDQVAADEELLRYCRAALDAIG